MSPDKSQRKGRPRTSSEPNYQVRALQRGLAILGTFSAQSPELTMAELSELLGIPKPTTYRLLEALRHERFVIYDEDSGRYSLGLRALELGSVYLATAPLERRAIPFLRELMLKTNQTANLGVLDDYEVLHVAVVEPDRALRYHSQVGARDYLHCTGLGKILASTLGEDDLMELARRVGLPKRTEQTITELRDLRGELDRVRSEGYAEDNQESTQGLRCLAAPVRSMAGGVVAAMSISGPAGEFEDDAFESLKAALLTEANALSERLGWASSE